MYYSLRYYKEEKQLVGLFFTKGVVERVVKLLDIYTHKEFVKILFENRNCTFEDVDK